MQAWESMTLHAHNAHEAGQAIHMQAVPSEAEALMHESSHEQRHVAPHTLDQSLMIAVQAWESMTLHAHNAHEAGQAIHMQAAHS